MPNQILPSPNPHDSCTGILIEVDSASGDQVIERGLAQRVDPGSDWWDYQSTVTLPMPSAVTVEASAVDWAGNADSRVQRLAN